MKAAKLWPLAVAGVLAVTVGANVAVLIAAQDGGAIEPDYYRKAVRWDSTLAERRRSEALGWRLETTLGALDRQGRAVLRARLVDGDGSPIAGATVTAAATHNLDPLRPIVGTLAADGASGYRGELGLARRGLWQVRIQAVRGGQRFEADARLDCAPAGGVANREAAASVTAVPPNGGRPIPRTGR
jgi:hypothetical protein